jgi:hypothetical protein
MFLSASCQAAERRPDDDCTRMPATPKRRDAFSQIENRRNRKRLLHLLEWRRAESGFHRRNSALPRRPERKMPLCARVI